MDIKSIIKSIFLYRFPQKQRTYVVNFTVSIGVWAIALAYLQLWGGSYVYLIFIPTEIKVVIAEIVYIVALVAAAYFFIRFILGFFIDREDKESSASLDKKYLGEFKNIFKQAVKEALKEDREEQRQEEIRKAGDW